MRAQNYAKCYFFQEILVYFKKKQYLCTPLRKNCALNALADIEKLMSVEVAQFRQAYEKSLASDNPLLQQVAEHLLARRGKQLRPIMTVLAAEMLGNVNEATTYGAVALELLHNATLMHDDVIDQSPTRRGSDTINKIWDNKVAVLMGEKYLRHLLGLIVEICKSLHIAGNILACV